MGIDETKTYCLCLIFYQVRSRNLWTRNGSGSSGYASSDRGRYVRRCAAAAGPPDAATAAAAADAASLRHELWVGPEDDVPWPAATAAAS